METQQNNAQELDDQNLGSINIETAGYVNVNLIKLIDSYVKKAETPFQAKLNAVR